MRFTRRQLLLAMLVVLAGSSAHAKRLGPKAVKPVVADGVRYKVPHFGAFHGKAQNGGFVQAWDVNTGKLKWDRMIYRVRYEADLEKDVQDDFITEINVKGATLLVKTERAEEFEMDLASGHVRALSPLGPRIEVAASDGPDAVQPGVAAHGAAPRR